MFMTQAEGLRHHLKRAINKRFVADGGLEPPTSRLNFVGLSGFEPETLRM